MVGGGECSLWYWLWLAVGLRGWSGMLVGIMVGLRSIMMVLRRIMMVLGSIMMELGSTMVVFRRNGGKFPLIVNCLKTGKGCLCKIMVLVAWLSWRGLVGR